MAMSTRPPPRIIRRGATPLADDFTRNRFLWLEQVAFDRALSPAAFKIAFVISRYINRDSRVAWPKQQLLARDAGMSRRGMQLCIADLVRRNHLHVVNRKKQCQPSIYSMILHGECMKHGPCEQITHAMRTTLRINKNSLREPFDILPLTPAAPRAESVSASGDAAASPQRSDEPFERFAAAWTFGEGESLKAARAAFRRLNKDDREAAIRGAAAFQGGMLGRKHPPHASTYLSEKKWSFTPSPRWRERLSPPPKSLRLAPVKARRMPDGRWRFEPDAPQLLAWKEFERKTRDDRRAVLDLYRPSEWPPGQGATHADRDNESRAPPGAGAPVEPRGGAGAL